MYTYTHTIYIYIYTHTYIYIYISRVRAQSAACPKGIVRRSGPGIATYAKLKVPNRRCSCFSGKHDVYVFWSGTEGGAINGVVPPGSCYFGPWKTTPQWRAFVLLACE